MKRQSLEEKLFSYQDLSVAQKRALDRSVKNDPELTALAEGWRSVETQLVAAEMEAPGPGFRLRWLERHQQDLLRRERIQAAWITFFSSSAAVALLVFLLQRVIPSFAVLKQLLFSFLNGIIEFVAFVQIVLNLSLSLLQKLPPGIWASIGAAILLLPLLWYAAFRELSFTKGVYK